MLIICLCDVKYYLFLDTSFTGKVDRKNISNDQRVIIFQWFMAMILNPYPDRVSEGTLYP